MFAVYAAGTDAENPLGALGVGELQVESTPGGRAVPQDWVEVRVRAAALNHHDLFSLRGVGLSAEACPMVLGCDAAGVTDDGSEVLVHAVINDPAFSGPDTTTDPRRSLLSERYPGTLASSVWVPRANLVPKPEGLSFVEAACLPTAWLTAYRMLFVRSGVRPGDTVLIQGAGGGVATALVMLASHAGLRVWVTSRSADRGERAVELGADAWFRSGDRLPERVDAVMESVGAATWSHSINALRPGGTVVLCGTTSGAEPSRAELTKIFFKPLQVIGSTMGTRDELTDLVSMIMTTGVRPVIDSSVPMEDAAEAFARLESGQGFGKIVLTRV